MFKKKQKRINKIEKLLIANIVKVALNKRKYQNIMVKKNNYV
jgi:hypothetical protein